MFWLVLLILFVAGIVYCKVYYPNSNHQLRGALKFVEAAPIVGYFQTEEKSCGIWYRRKTEQSEILGRSNDKVKDCFIQAATDCQKKNILLVDDESMEDSGVIKYALIRIVNKNDAGKCLFQTSYEEQKNGQEEKMPISYINTCTEIKENLMTSCEPTFLDDLRKINEQQ